MPGLSRMTPGPFLNIRIVNLQLGRLHAGSERTSSSIDETNDG